MAKFFKYKSVADLEAENARLGLDLRYSDDFAPLFTPTQVGSRTVGNRWCIHPMEGCDGNLDGTPGELTFRRYNRFGDGGAKIIWGEACAVNEEARANPRQIWLNADTKPEFARLVQECRQAHRAMNGDDSDLLFGIQLTHSGRYSYRRPVIATHDPLLDPRTVVNKSTGAKVTPDYPLITDDELKRLIEGLKSDNSWIGYWCLSAIGSLDATEAVPAIIAAPLSESKFQFLAGIGTPAALSPLISVS